VSSVIISSQVSQYRSSVLVPCDRYVKYQVIAYQLSCIRYQVSGIRCQVIACQVSVTDI